MKIPTSQAVGNPKTPDPRQYLTSWKAIAQYMGAGVRTVQRYEREFGLPVRRPTGTRGAVMATRAEIDAWVAAAPIRKTFRLVRVEPSSRTQMLYNKIEEGVKAMSKLKAQTLALRSETRSVLNLLIDRVSAVRLLMPPARPDGYEPLVNMNMDMNVDVDRRFHKESAKDLPKLSPTRSKRRDKNSTRPPNQISVSTAQKPN
jgi:hypothetical protein